MASVGKGFRRITGLLLHARDTFEEITEAPTGWKWIFLYLIGILTLFSIYLIQVPTGLSSILIGASTFPMYLIILLYLLVMVIASAFLFLFLLIVYQIGIRLRRSHTTHRSRKIIYNLYIYSLTPFILLISQIPFVLIFGGHYSLFNLTVFYYFLLGFVFGWHFFLFYRAIQTAAEMSPQRAQVITGIYIGSLGTFTGILIYAILYINFDISWLGGLIG
ncbi:MAG: YIP1 family protein [Candidatus Helarchaeota archaeon]